MAKLREELVMAPVFGNNSRRRNPERNPMAPARVVGHVTNNEVRVEHPLGFEMRVVPTESVEPLEKDLSPGEIHASLKPQRRKKEDRDSR